jgi:GNAT superfamily N-acetyltransferase
VIPVTERIEIAVTRSLFGQGVRGTALLEVAGAVCCAFEPLPGATMLNRVLGLGVESPAADDHLDEIDRFFREHGCRYQIALAPGSEPDDLCARLREHGLAPGYSWMKFRRNAASPPAVEASVRVEPICRDRAPEFARVVAGAYGMPEVAHEWIASVVGAPGWHCYLAFDGDEAAGAGALFVDGGGGWLGIAGTLPDHRRKGAQGAILAARIRHAAELGVETLVTETGEAVVDRPSNSYRNILRFGFEEAYLRPNYVSPLT